MPVPIDETLQIGRHPRSTATLVLAFTGWMDGGDVSSGTVQRLVDLLAAEPIAEINPGTVLYLQHPRSDGGRLIFRPHVEVSGGLLKKIEMPTNRFYCHQPANLVLSWAKSRIFTGTASASASSASPARSGLRNILFVALEGLHFTRGAAALHHLFGCESAGGDGAVRVRRSDYQGPGSFTNYLMAQAASAGLQMISWRPRSPVTCKAPIPPVSPPSRGGWRRSSVCRWTPMPFSR